MSSLVVAAKKVDKKADKNKNNVTPATTPQSFKSLPNQIVYPFKGYNLDDRRYQLDGQLMTYRSYVTTICYRFEEWLYYNKYLNVEIESFGERIFFGYEFDNKRKLTKNINAILMQLLDNTIVTETFILSSENDRTELSVNIRLPNGLQIETAIGSKTVVQKLNRSSYEETKRTFYSNGCVVIHYSNDCWKILTSNGAIYESLLNDDELINNEDANEKETNENDSNEKKTNEEGTTKLNEIYCDYINALTNYPEIDLNNAVVKLTMTNGCVLLIQNGNIVSFVENLLRIGINFFFS